MHPIYETTDASNRKMNTTQEFNRLNNALNVAIVQGAKRISALNPYNPQGKPSFSLERTALTVEKAPATCTLSLNSEGKWELSPWYLGTGGHIELQPSPTMALARAIAQYYFSDKPRIENIPLPRIFEAGDEEFYYNNETLRYQSGNQDFSVEEVLGYFLLSPEEQESNFFPTHNIKSWTL